MPSISVHVGVGLGGLEEADAVVVGVADGLGEGFLAEVALHGSAHAAGAEGEPGDLDSGVAEGDPVGGGLLRCSCLKGLEREASGGGEGSGG